MTGDGAGFIASSYVPDSIVKFKLFLRIKKKYSLSSRFCTGNHEEIHHFKDCFKRRRRKFSKTGTEASIFAVSRRSALPWPYSLKPLVSIGFPLFSLMFMIFRQYWPYVHEFG